MSSFKADLQFTQSKKHACSSPIRACIFDMDGLLINTEDLYFVCMNNILAKYNRPPIPWSLKPRLMGVPSPVAAGIFYEWAQLPISREQLDQEQAEQQKLHYPDCQLLPGVARLLSDLKSSKVKIAMASSSSREMYDLKTARPEIKQLFEVFEDDKRILGDRVLHSRGKPAPDIFLIALEPINSTLDDKIRPEECLVFEDSVPGVEAGRRAGMRVVWVPHPKLATEYEGKEKEVLAGRNGMSDVGDEWQLGEIDDGWAECLPSLEDFPYEKYGIHIEVG